MTDLLARCADALCRLVRLLARPVRGDRGGGGFYILPYRGYGSRKEIFIMGRVFRQAPRGENASGGFRRDLSDLLRRLHRRGVSGATVRVRFAGTQAQVITDREGYFRASLRPETPPPSDRLWHEVDVDLAGSTDAASRVRGEVFIPPDRARFVVISDIDDTVMLTGVANKLKMVWRLFVQGAASRVAFPGVAAFYRALHEGEDRQPGTNPILYVSRGPWGLYEVLDEFFHLHRIPVGPILFLREWGFSWRRPFPRRASGHKRDLIETMLAIYPELPFLLIGDSGQHDPEIYAGVVESHPGRVAAVYIRNVSRDSGRIGEITHLAEGLRKSGSPLVLAADSFAMAEHAVSCGLIDEGALREVVRERRSQREGRLPRQPVRRVEEPAPGEVGEALRGKSSEARTPLEGSEEAPPNLVVEPGEAKRKK